MSSHGLSPSEAAGQTCEYKPGANKLKPWCVNGKQMALKAVLAVADKMRAARNLTPLDVEHSVRA